MKFDLRFIDSFRFMQTSFANLSSNLKKDEFIYLGKFVNELELMTRKGVFPCNYFDSIEKFQDTKLPPEFVNKSRMKTMNMPKNFWEKFECETMADYLNLYLKGF